MKRVKPRVLKEQLLQTIAPVIRSGSDGKLFHIVTSAGTLDLPGTAQVQVKTGVSTVQLPVVGIKKDNKLIVGRRLLEPDQIEANLRRDKRYDDSYFGIHHSEGVTKLRAAFLARFKHELGEPEWAARVTRQGSDFSPQQYTQLALDIHETLQVCGDPSLLRSRDTIRDWLSGKTLAPKDFDSMFALLSRDYPELNALLSRSFSDAYRFYTTVKSAVTRMIGNVPAGDAPKPKQQSPARDEEPSFIKRLARQYIEEVGMDAVAARVLSIEVHNNGAVQSDLGFIGTGSILSPETLQETAVAVNIVEKIVQAAISDALACGAITVRQFLHAIRELSSMRHGASGVVADPESSLNVFLQNAIITRYGGNLSFAADADRIMGKLMQQKSKTIVISTEDISKTPTGRVLCSSWFEWAETGFPALHSIPAEPMEAALAGWAERLNALPTELRLLWVLNDFNHRARYGTNDLDMGLWQAAWDNISSVVHARYPGLPITHFTRIPISDYRRVRREKFHAFSRIWGMVEEDLALNPFVDWQGMQTPSNFDPRFVAALRQLA